LTGGFDFTADFADLALAAGFGAGLATDFFSALRAGGADLDGADFEVFDFAADFFDFDALLAMAHNQSARGRDKGRDRVTPRFVYVAQAAGDHADVGIGAGNQR
jgi:hypothetical protein